MIEPMSPLVILVLLVVALLALVPIWRLRVAGWPSRWLTAAWLTLTIAGVLVVQFPGPARFLIPLLVLAYVAPFVAGPERLTRVLGGRREREVRGVVIDVTPRIVRRDAPEPDDTTGPPAAGDTTGRDGEPPRDADPR